MRMRRRRSIQDSKRECRRRIDSGSMGVVRIDVTVKPSITSRRHAAALQRPYQLF